MQHVTLRTSAYSKAQAQPCDYFPGKLSSLFTSLFPSPDALHSPRPVVSRRHKRALRYSTGRTKQRNQCCRALHKLPTASATRVALVPAPAQLTHRLSCWYTALVHATGQVCVIAHCTTTQAAMETHEAHVVDERYVHAQSLRACHATIQLWVCNI